ncbi:MAG: HAMP domain-containing protein [Acidobacteria bacterium]|nr:HAMP domain-containing protein [Acidobacteriota bacterium]
MFNTVRLRLTLWYTLVFGVLLLLFSVFVYLSLEKNLYYQFDNSLWHSGEIITAAFENELDESHDDSQASAVEALREIHIPEVYTAIFADEQLLHSNYPEPQAALLPITLRRSLQQQPRAFTTLAGFGEAGARLVAIRISRPQHEFIVTAAQPLDETIEQLEAIRRIFYFGLPAALLIAGGGGFLLAKKSLAPVLAMSHQARRISASNLHERLPVANAADELGQLAATFNELLCRLHHSFATMREFMADASHELRTPIAIIRGEAEVALTQKRAAAEYQETLTVIADEARLLTRLVDDLLALARADAGERQLTLEEFYLNDVVEDCCRAAQVLALRKEISLTCHTTADLAFRGDEELLRRMLLNLLDNAIKYTPRGGVVAVQLRLAEPHIQMTVTDSGIGIPAAEAAHIFERFYRVDKARSRAEGGSGLGLAIARWVAEAHHGSIQFTSLPGQGSIFTVMLPQ